MTSDTILRIDGLEVAVTSHKRKTTLVHDVSVSLKRGETLGVVGESGSGKTLTSLSVMRLLAPPLQITAGSIHLGDVDITRTSVQAMREIRGRQVSMIFQEPMTSLNPVLSIGRQLTETLRAHFKVSSKEAVDKAVALLERVRIPNAAAKLNSYPFEFSGGMRQRVMIAMALICEPELIIADEPTTALDVTIQAEVLDLLNELKREFNMAMIFISHDLGVISEVADRVLVMYKGRIVERGNVADIMERPEHPYTEALLGARPFMVRGAAARNFDRHTRRLSDLSDLNL